MKANTSCLISCNGSQCNGLEFSKITVDESFSDLMIFCYGFYKHIICRCYDTHLTLADNL